MHVTRSAKAPLYRMPGHDGMTMRRLQGHEAGPSSSMGLGLLEIQPGGGTAAMPSPHEKIYFVQAGEVTISNGDHADVLKAGDSCRFAEHEPQAQERQCATRHPRAGHGAAMTGTK